MENKKTLKPGQLATVKSGKIFGRQGEIVEMRGIVRASKEFDEPCCKCYQQNGSRRPCRLLMPLEKCQQMFGWHMFPIVVYNEKTVFNT